MLGYPDFQRTFILEVDASFLDLGAVLSQERDDGKKNVIVYASRGLRPNERNMCSYCFLDCNCYITKPHSAATCTVSFFIWQQMS